MAPAAAAKDQVIEQLSERLRSLESNCLKGLEEGLDAVVSGDLTRSAAPVTKPIDAESDDPAVQELVEVFNRMLGRAQSALENYDEMRQTLCRALGDQSILFELSERLHSLHDNCLTNLGSGLDAMANGDLTVDVQPVTTPIERPNGGSIGEFGALFNGMLGKAQGALESYNTTRDQLRVALGDTSCLPQLLMGMASLDDHCLQNLEDGLQAMTVGDLTRDVSPVTTPIATRDGENPGEFAGVFNSMLGKAQAALEGYNEMREQLRSVLGDQSVLIQLRERLHSLHDNCLTNLNDGLQSMADGDLSIEVLPKTTPIESPDGISIGEFGELFNAMLVKAQASLEGYNATREGFRVVLGDDSCVDSLRTRMISLDGNCLANLRDGLLAMRDGDLTKQVKPVTTPIVARDGRDLGEFAGVFNEMLAKAQVALEGYEDMRAKLAAMIRNIQTSSESVASASTQMASTSEEAGRAVGEIAHAVGDVAQGAERQVRTVEDAKAMAQDVAAASQLSAENAQETATAAQEARGYAEEGATAVTQATEAMRAVKESSAEVSEAMRSLGDKSTHIGGIVATITGIAQQTNLLALNAAIEAARAGDQGRGFAVVAEEVRKLAEESQQAAANIGSLIQEIQKETSRAVEVVETGARRTEEGAATVEQARASFLRIGSSVEDMNGRVDQIAAAVQQIASSSQRMQDSMNDVAALAEQSSAATEEVSASTEQTSASTEEIAASAQQLASTAEELERLVGQFTLV
jgi:methyl-accepting chemotaxis protein